MLQKTSTDDVSRAILVRALQSAGAGDRSAFETVFRKTSTKLFGICVRILGDEAEAEDVLQEVYISIWREAARFDATRASPITWLATMARNRSIDRLRARRVRPVVVLDEAMEVADHRPDPGAAAEQLSEDRRLDFCLAELPGQQAQLLRSAFWGGLSYRELADAAAVPLGTMKSGIRRSLLRLRDCMDR